jgi:hypothetical protein
VVGQVPAQRVKTKLATHTVPSRVSRLTGVPRLSVSSKSGTRP